ncbi:MAG TPA: serine hydroxymethyltransferase [Candidatus Woesebacteria bacterium]|nr:serine hydroxymethyltransferase [Candidatus Woesebacteria bacterium]
MQDKAFELIDKETKRQIETLSLIPSENYASKGVREAVGSVLANKYAEGYPGKRYYQGNAVMDEIESLSQERGKKLFGLEHINVQPYSGSPANMAVLLALVEPHETICGMELSAGGHLTHGHRVSVSGKWFRSVQYGVNEEGKIDYEALARLVNKEKPKIIFAGTTAYPWNLDWKRFGEIADSVGAYLVADISHIAGLVAAGVMESPVDFAHIITSTTHKSLRGPRGAFVGVTNNGLEKDTSLDLKIDKAVFPGLQGGPHMNTIAGMAVAFEEATSSSFADYAGQILRNARALASGLRERGLKVYGTENHLLLIEVEEGKGKEVAEDLEQVGIIVNANTVPGEPGSPLKPSGIRVGTPAVTTRGMKETEMRELANLIADVIQKKTDRIIKDEVLDLAKRFPCP